MIDVEMPPSYKKYFQELDEKVNKLYKIAEEARKKGLDPTSEPEPKITRDIAERVEKLIGPEGITERMRELGAMDRRAMSFKVARESSLGKYCGIATTNHKDVCIMVQQKLDDLEISRFGRL